jgi:hypothetical protein
MEAATMELIFLYFLLTLVVAMMAATRGRSSWRWFLIALFLTPLISGLLVMALPPLYRSSVSARLTEREAKMPAPLVVPMPTDSTIRIIRNASNSEHVRPFDLFINGALVARIESRGIVDIPVPSGRLIIEARTAWLTSRPVKIETVAGQRIDIELTDRGGPLLALSDYLLGTGQNFKLRELPPISIRHAA